MQINQRGRNNREETFRNPFLSTHNQAKESEISQVNSLVSE